MRLPDARLLILNATLAFALAGTYWANRTAQPQAVPTDFLQSAPLSFRNWKTNDLDLSERERGMLRPDATLIRNYTSPTGDSAQIAVIAGHRKQTVHTPAFCMTGGGWEILSTKGWTLPLEGRMIQGTRAVMQSGPQELTIIYLFTDGDFTTRSLVEFQGRQLWTRLRGEAPMGALVRIVVPIRGDNKSSEQLSEEFARTLLPEVMRRLREAHTAPPKTLHTY